MKTGAKKDGLYDGGLERWEETDDYRKRVSQIVKEATETYEVQIRQEANLFRRLWLRFRLFMEIRKKVGELSSPRNLHLNHEPPLM